MITVGIDIGGRQHAVARCRAGATKADRKNPRIGQDRAGFDRLDAWLARQQEPVGSVTMESSGHYWMCLASHLDRGPIPATVVNPLGAKYFAKSRLSRTKSTRPMRGASRSWPSTTSPPPAPHSRAWSCAKRHASR